ncbi:MAG: hypothetical protein HY851_00290 [candidate division Zixibacteria bacterium]|nr:hypothetical protein [candidate division Zixibacteria bacterium]
MINKEYIELMNRDIDGVISPADRTKLRQFLDASEEGRTYYEGLVLASSELSRLTPELPPADLKRSVMAQVSAYHAGRARYHRPEHNLVDRLFNWLAAHPALGVTSGAVGGALATIIITSASGWLGGPSLVEVTGTLVRQGSPNQQSLVSCSLSAGPTSAVIATDRAGDQVVMRVRINSDGTTPQIRLTFDQSDLSLDRIFEGDRPSAAVDATPGVISISPASGTEYSIIFRDRSESVSSIHVSVSDGSFSADQDIATGISVRR